VEQDLKQETYSTQQVADLVGVHKNTLLNWIRNRKVSDAERDWKGYRVWTGQDVKRLLDFKSKYSQMKLDMP
jgi:site-specific DNA-methyltransferase (cytosine-N4-specific)